MRFRIPPNTDKYYWTEHSLFKMKQYGLSAQRVLRVIRNPQRREEGIVKSTVAVMQPASTRRVDGKVTWKQEIWVMYQLRKSEASTSRRYKVEGITSDDNKLMKLRANKLKIISAWRYPGVSPERGALPEEILREIEEAENGQ